MLGAFVGGVYTCGLTSLGWTVLLQCGPVRAAYVTVSISDPQQPGGIFVRDSLGFILVWSIISHLIFT